MLVHPYVCTLMCILMCTSLCVSLCMSSHPCVYTSLYMHPCVRPFVCALVYTLVYVHPCILVCVHPCIYTSLCMHQMHLQPCNPMHLAFIPTTTHCLFSEYLAQAWAALNALFLSLSDLRSFSFRVIFTSCTVCLTTDISESSVALPFVSAAVL